MFLHIKGVLCTRKIVLLRMDDQRWRCHLGNDLFLHNIDKPVELSHANTGDAFVSNRPAPHSFYNSCPERFILDTIRFTLLEGINVAGRSEVSQGQQEFVPGKSPAVIK